MKTMSGGRKVSFRTCIQISGLGICCSIMPVVFVCPWNWSFGGMGRRATRMLARFEHFDLIVEPMFLTLQYTGHFILPPERFVRCVWLMSGNKGSIVPLSSPRSYWSGPNHRTYDETQLTYLFSLPLVAWFHLWVDMFLSLIELLCWSIHHMFPKPLLLHEELTAFTRIVVKEMCVILITKIVGIGQTIVTHFEGFPTVNAYRIEHFIQPFE